MSDSIRLSADPDKGRWSKSVSKNGVTKSVEVRKIENGYLVTVCNHGTKKKEDGTEEYFDNTREIFTKENPLEDIDDEFKTEKKLIDDMKKSVYTPSMFDLL